MSIAIQPGKTATPAVSLNYSHRDPQFADFGGWLERFQTSGKFIAFASEMIEIEKKLTTEPVGETRIELVKRRWRLIDEH